MCHVGSSVRCVCDAPGGSQVSESRQVSTPAHPGRARCTGAARRLSRWAGHLRARSGARDVHCGPALSPRSCARQEAGQPVAPSTGRAGGAPTHPHGVDDTRDRSGASGPACSVPQRAATRGPSCSLALRAAASPPRPSPAGDCSRTRSAWCGRGAPKCATARCSCWARTWVALGGHCTGRAGHGGGLSRRRAASKFRLLRRLVLRTRAGRPRTGPVHEMMCSSERPPAVW